jgi:heme/copper-type cytochrome/quinol oxidase subunit 3
MTASVISAPAHEEEFPTNTGASNKKVAMWLFLGSDVLLFGALISTYVLYRDRPYQLGPQRADVFSIPYTSVSSFVLLMSSLTMVLALSAIRRGDHHRFRLWALATALLGATFIGGQIFEFTSFVHKGLSLSTNLFGSSFYVLTGFHGAHVTLGIVMLVTLFIRSLQGKLPTSHAENVETVGLYWHFVDVVWIVIFVVVYLIP